MNKLTREEALRRWKSAKATKIAMVDKMQKMLYEDYKLHPLFYIEIKIPQPS